VQKSSALKNPITTFIAHTQNQKQDGQDASLRLNKELEDLKKISDIFVPSAFIMYIF